MKTTQKLEKNEKLKKISYLSSKLRNADCNINNITDEINSFFSFEPVLYCDVLYIVSRSLKINKFYNLYELYIKCQIINVGFEREPTLAFYYAESLLAQSKINEIELFVNKVFDNIESDWVRLELVEILCDSHLWECGKKYLTHLKYSGSASKIKYLKIKERITISLNHLKSPEINTLYINLDKDSWKRNRIECHLKSLDLNYIRIPGVLSKQLPEIVIDKITKSNLLKTQIGALGCFFGHVAALEKVVEMDVDAALILEDDAYFFYKPSEQILGEILKNDFDLIYVNCKMMKSDVINSNPFGAEPLITRLRSFPDTISGWGAYGYIITKKGAKILLSNIKNDMAIGHFDGQIGSYSLIGQNFIPENKAQLIGKRFINAFSSKSEKIKCGCLNFPLISYKEYDGSSRVNNS